MSILCATNFSPEAIHASTVAAELARQRGVDLWLVFVLANDTAKAFGEQVLATANDTLKGEAARLRKLGANVHPALLMGKLHRALPPFVADNKVSLVIAGDVPRDPGFTGTGLLARLGLHLEAPLLAVRNPEPLIEWARGKRTLRVMLGVDQTRSTDIAVRWIEQLSKFGKIELVAGHVFFPAAEYYRFGLPLPQTWNAVDPALLEALHRELSAKVPASLPHRARFMAATGRVSDHLGALASEEKIDLLVLGTHHRKALAGVWSVSEQCLQTAPMSVVSVPAGQGEADQPPQLAHAERVLIATDFSPTGDSAVAWGLGIVAPGGTADLVNVSSKPPTAAEERKIIDQLMARVPAEMRSRGVLINAHALVAVRPADAIVAASERFSSSVICLGSRANTSLSKLVFGSTAQGVLDVSTRPVLVVRRPEP